MPVTVKPIMTRRLYDFTGLAVGSSATVVVERAVDLHFGERVELLVRVHEAHMELGSSIDVIARPIALTPEDPAVDFLVEENLETTVTIDNTNDDDAPLLLLKSLPRPFGPQVQIRVRAARLLGLVGCRAVLSAELVCRD